MFKKIKAETIVENVKKYAGKELLACVKQENGEWVVDVDILEKEFSLRIFGIKVNFKMREVK